LTDLEFSKVYLPLAPVWKNACPVSYRLHIPFLFRRKEKKDRRRLLSPNSKPYQAVSLADLEFSKVYLPLAPVWKNACPVSY
jgi:hypothetical protein